MSDTLSARSIIVLADCHIHPGRGIDWSPAALTAFAGTEQFLTLGDMGEASGVEALAKIAPVAGVRGQDDAKNPFTEGKVRRFDWGGLGVICVFDPVRAGLATAKDPIVPMADEAFDAAIGAPVDVLLWASTHAPSVTRIGGRLYVNPGSVTLPDKGAPASFARLTLADGAADAEIVTL